MKWPRDVKIIPAHCLSSKDRLFGIRTEKINGVWLMDWAFKMQPDQARRDGFTDSKISGQIFIDGEYPGCPYCGNPAWFQCGKCGSIVCSNADQTEAICPICGNHSRLIKSERFSGIKSGAM